MVHSALDIAIDYGLILANIALFGTSSYYNFLLCRKDWRRRVICVFTVLMSLYWTALYVYVFFSDLGIFPDREALWSTIWVRPALTMTGALMAIMGLVRWRREGG